MGPSNVLYLLLWFYTIQDCCLSIDQWNLFDETVFYWSFWSVTFRITFLNNKQNGGLAWLLSWQHSSGKLPAQAYDLTWNELASFRATLGPPGHLDPFSILCFSLAYCSAQRTSFVPPRTQGYNRGQCSGYLHTISKYKKVSEKLYIYLWYGSKGTSKWQFSFFQLRFHMFIMIIYVFDWQKNFGYHLLNIIEFSKFFRNMSSVGQKLMQRFLSLKNLGSHQLFSVVHMVLGKFCLLTFKNFNLPNRF